LQFHDYQLPYVEAKLRWFRGEPVIRYISLYQDMRKDAEHRLQVIERVRNRCPARHCPVAQQIDIDNLSQRAHHAATIAINNIAYGIAQDIAADVESAKPFEAIAEEYARTLAGIVNKGDKAFESGEISDEDELYTIRDTIGFVSLVIEAQKPNPGIDKIKEDAALFKGVIAHFETRVEHEQVTGRVDKRDLTALRSSRAHLSAARQFITE
jgi:hypothetical protein